MSTQLKDSDDCNTQLDLLRSILDSAADPVMAIGMNKRVIWMNRAAHLLSQSHPDHEKVPPTIRDTCHWLMFKQKEPCRHGAQCPLDIEAATTRHTQVIHPHNNPKLPPRSYEIHASPLVDSTGRRRGVVKIMRDVTDHENTLALLNIQEQALKERTLHDHLTGLPNRVLFMERADHALRQAQRSGGVIGFIFIDLVAFKSINDNLGHDVGDFVLRTIAQRLTGVVRESDTVARLGGDEFLILLDHIKAPGEALMVAGKIAEALKEPISHQSRMLKVGGSIGISIYPTDGDNSETLLRNADTAMYQAKRDGSTEPRLYSSAGPIPEHAATRNSRSDILLALETASESDFFMLYQPVVHLATNRIDKVEALLRWNAPGIGLLTPDQFLPVAEKSGLLQCLDEWVLLTVCRQYLEWRESGFKLHCISVNLSDWLLSRGDLADRVQNILALTQCPAQALEIEISETSIMAAPENIRQNLERVRALGVSIAIDDFGAGYTSLNYLKLLPISHIKLTRGLIQNLPASDHEASLARAIMALGHSMDINVVAKGIETMDQRDFLISEGCEQGQGYYYSQPLSSEHLQQQWPN